MGAMERVVCVPYCGDTRIGGDYRVTMGAGEGGSGESGGCDWSFTGCIVMSCFCYALWCYALGVV